MPRKKKIKEQVDLFPQELNRVSLEDYKAMSRKPVQHEKKFMGDIIETAFKLDLPCIHIKYFCGNTFYATCGHCSNERGQKIIAICPVCGRKVLVTCLNRLNRDLAGHFDLLGVDWAIELKHKTNKGPQEAKPAPAQFFKSCLYDVCNIPNLTANEDDSLKVYRFLRELHNRKFPERQI